MHHGNLINPSGCYTNQSDTEPHPQVSGHNLITLWHLLMKTLQYLYFILFFFFFNCYQQHVATSFLLKNKDDISAVRVQSVEKVKKSVTWKKLGRVLNIYFTKPHSPKDWTTRFYGTWCWEKITQLTLCDRIFTVLFKMVHESCQSRCFHLKILQMLSLVFLSLIITSFCHFFVAGW